MNGKTKIELLLELKNKVKTGLSTAKDNISKSVGTMKEKLTELKNSHVSAFKAMREEIPLFDRAMKVLGNPYIILAAGLLSLGVLFTKAANKAAEFNHEFLNIKQLNLDKSNQELETYKKQVKNVAFEVGLAGTDTVKAFYDIQSGTGLFGDSVAQITTKVGKFAIATGAQLPDAVNQTIKAMKAMKLSVSDIDAMLDSNAKTVQVGITTFAELARVQTEYLGAAAGAGQTLDTANKVFAAFTSIAKDSNTAATMTKTAFEGLTQKNTVEGLKEIGISLYDSTGNMRDLSEVLKETSQRFKGMSSEQIDAVINKIGGPEGLRNLFVKLKTGADDFFNTLTAFDSSQFNLDKALQNAKGDFTVLHTMAKNRLGLVIGEIGEKILPLWVAALERANNALQFVWNNLDAIKNIIGMVVLSLGSAKVAMIALNIATSANPIGGIISLILKAIPLIVGGITALISRTEGWGKSWAAIKDIISITWKQAKMDWEFMIESFKHGINVLWLRFKGLGQYLKELFLNIGDSIKLALKGDFSGAKAALTRPIVTEASKEIDALKAEYDQKKNDYINSTRENAAAIKEAFGNVSIKWKKKEEQQEQTETDNQLLGSPDADLTTAPAGGDNYGNASNSIDKITGSAKQIQNITVNIDSFNKGGINTQNTSLQHMSAEDIEKWMNDMFTRVVNNVARNFA